jgi:hypothetical protein
MTAPKLTFVTAAPLVGFNAVAAGGACVMALAEVEVALAVEVYVHHVEVGVPYPPLCTEAVPTAPLGVVTVSKDLVALDVIRVEVTPVGDGTDAVAVGVEAPRDVL